MTYNQNPQRTIASNVTLVDGDYLAKINTTVARIITLPIISTVGHLKEYIVVDSTGTAGTFNVTINAGAGDFIDGLASYTINDNRAGIKFIAVDTNKWISLGLNGIVPISKGGTGQITQTLGFNALDPLTTKGDIIVHDGTNSVRQGVGADGTMIIADSTVTNGVRYAGSTFRASVTAGIDAKTLAATPLYTVPAGKKFITDYVVVYPTAVTGTGNGPRYSVGTNAATYNNILATTFTINMDTIVEYGRANVIGTAHIGAAAEVINYNVTTISTATTMTVSVELRGHFI